MKWENHTKGIMMFPLIDGQVQIDYEALKKPFIWPWAICRYVCTSCGQASEIDIDCVRGFLRTMRYLKTPPEIVLAQNNLPNYYFAINYCNNCKNPGKNQEVKLELKEIK